MSMQALLLMISEIPMLLEEQTQTRLKINKKALHK